MIERVGEHIHFLHLRNSKRDSAGNVHEGDLLSGGTDMYAAVNAIIRLMQHRQCAIPMHAGHRHQPLTQRVKALAEMRGLEMGINKGK